MTFSGVNHLISFFSELSYRSHLPKRLSGGVGSHEPDLVKLDRARRHAGGRARLCASDRRRWRGSARARTRRFRRGLGRGGHHAGGRGRHDYI